MLFVAQEDCQENLEITDMNHHENSGNVIFQDCWSVM